VFLGLGIAFLAQPRVDNHSSLELTAARGAQVRFSISADASIQGFWAAPGGIQVLLGNDVTYYSRYVEVLEPSHSLESIPDLTEVSDQHRDNTTIPIDLTLPDDIPGPAAQTLQGEITNYIFLPVPATSGGYEVVERELDVSLKIHLAPAVPALYQIRYHPEPIGYGVAALATFALFADTIIGAEVLYWLGVRDVATLKAAVDTKRLLRALRHKDASVRREAALALGELHSYPALSPLMDALRDPESEVRVAAARALAEIGDWRAQAPLSSTAAKDNDASVREAATAALTRLPKL
jgi:HEAT repeats